MQLNHSNRIILKTHLLLLIFLISSCGQKKDHPIEQNITSKDLKTTQTDIDSSEEKSLYILNGVSNVKYNLEKPTVLIIELDSLEIEQVKNEDEGKFFTAVDDLMWYNSLLANKMDSLEIDVITTNKDTVFLKANDVNVVVHKNSQSPLFTYYYFDGQIVRKTDLYELLSK